MAVNYLDATKTYLENNGYGSRTIKTGKLPDEPDRVISIRPTGGTDPEMHLGQNEPSEKRPDIQVLVRDEANEAGRAWSDIHAIHDLLHESRPTGTELLRALEGGPNELPDDQGKGRPVYAANFQFLIVE